MRPLLLATVVLFLPACSAGVSFIIKDPIVEKCTSAGIQGCPDLTEGVILFVEGKQDEGKEKVLHGAAANSPEQLKEFAVILQLVGKIPGTEEYMGPVLEVAKIILEEAKNQRPAKKGKTTTDSALADKSPDRAHDDRPAAPPIIVQAPSGPTRTLTADTDAERIGSGITAPWLNPTHVSCTSPFGLGAAWCTTVVKGPFVVTDLSSGPGCQGDLFASAADSESRAWALAGSSLSPLVVHGGRLLVRQGESLILGAGGKGAAEPRCVVTWSGFKPYKRPEQRDAAQELLMPTSP
jgi:hypothetical protein